MVSGRGQFKIGRDAMRRRINSAKASRYRDPSEPEPWSGPGFHTMTWLCPLGLQNSSQAVTCMKVCSSALAGEAQTQPEWGLTIASGSDPHLVCSPLGPTFSSLYILCWMLWGYTASEPSQTNPRHGVKTPSLCPHQAPVFRHLSSDSNDSL